MKKDTTTENKTESPEKKNEAIDFTFLGMKLRCTNPSVKTVIIVSCLLLFFVAVMIMFPGVSFIKKLWK